jgi:hypothetical protein
MARALSARVTRPAASAVLSTALFAALIAWSRKCASRILASRTLSSSFIATSYAKSF